MSLHSNGTKILSKILTPESSLGCHCLKSRMYVHVILIVMGTIGVRIEKNHLHASMFVEFGLSID